jgi:hypothetical protein
MSGRGNVNGAVGVSAHFEQLLKQLAQQHVNATWLKLVIIPRGVASGKHAKRWKDPPFFIGKSW